MPLRILFLTAYVLHFFFQYFVICSLHIIYYYYQLPLELRFEFTPVIHNYAEFGEVSSIRSVIYQSKIIGRARCSVTKDSCPQYYYNAHIMVWLHNYYIVCSRNPLVSLIFTVNYIRTYI